MSVTLSKSGYTLVLLLYLYLDIKHMYAIKLNNNCVFRNYTFIKLHKKTDNQLISNSDSDVYQIKLWWILSKRKY